MIQYFNIFVVKTHPESDKDEVGCKRNTNFWKIGKKEGKRETFFFYMSICVYIYTEKVVIAHFSVLMKVFYIHCTRFSGSPLQTCT